MSIQTPLHIISDSIPTSMLKQIYILRDLFRAVDFDESLILALFGTKAIDLCDSCHEKLCTYGDNQAANFSDAEKTVAHNSFIPKANNDLPCNFSLTPTATLSCMLSFLKMDSASIPQYYLDTMPAKNAIICLMEDHNNLYQSLMQALPMTLSHYATKVYVDYIGVISSSIEDLEGRLDYAIEILTKINQNNTNSYCDSGCQELNKNN